MQDYLPEIFTLLAIALVLIILRVVARWTSAGPRNFSPDDYLMPLVVYTLEVLLAYPFGSMVKGLANDSIPPEYRDALDPSSEEYDLRVQGSTVQLAGWCLYTLILWLLKLCMCFFYFRLTEGLLDVTNKIKVALGVVGVTYVVTILSILVRCTPIQKNWQIFWKAKTHLKRKIVLLILFSGAIFIIAASIVRGVVILRSHGDGSLQAGLWACRESFVAIAIGNIPMVYPLIRRIIRNTPLAALFPSMAKSSNTHGPQSSHAAGTSRTMNSPSHTLQDDTAFDSQERIMLETHITASHTRDEKLNSDTSKVGAIR